MRIGSGDILSVVETNAFHFNGFVS